MWLWLPVTVCEGYSFSVQVGGLSLLLAVLKKHFDLIDLIAIVSLKVEVSCLKQTLFN